MIKFDQLISHRFRGFSDRENTIEGLVNALDYGVQVLEFDIRVTKCGTPIIYHDENALDKNGKTHHIANIFARDLEILGGTFAHMPTADELFKTAASHRNNSAKLLVDIKDFGFEEEINALIHLHRLEHRTVYVSWVPNVLYRMAEIAPHIPLCLSHWPQNPNKAIRAKHHVHEAVHGDVPRLVDQYIHGQRSGWHVDGGLGGELRDIIKNSGGSVCLPADMLNQDLIKAYQADGIEVSAFSFVDWQIMDDFEKSFELDLYFIDNKTVFENHPALFRLVSYGTLAPGRHNNNQLDDLKGNWVTGTVKGQIIDVSWKGQFGYPAFIPDPDGDDISVYIFESRDLPGHWARLDKFEGQDYRRVVRSVQTEDGIIEASIYKSEHS